MIVTFTAFAAAAVALALGAIAGWLARERETVGLRETASHERARAAEIVLQLSRSQDDQSLQQAELAGLRATNEALRREIVQLGALLDAERKQREALDSRAAQAENEATKARTQLLAERESFERARAGIEPKLMDQLQEVTQNALSRASTSFLELAAAKLGEERQVAAGNLDVRVKEIKSIMAPVELEFQKFSQAVAGLQKSSAEDFGSLKSSLSQVAQLQGQLQESVRTTNDATGQLRNALQNPHVAGNWGEISLDRIVELAGMTEHSDFDRQAGVRSIDGSSERPDLMIRLTGGLQIPVDAKASMVNYMKAAAEQNEPERQRLLKQSAVDLRSRVAELRARAYDRIEGYAGMTMLFVPNEAMLSSALNQDRGLLEEAARSRIVICSPLLLFCYLQAFANGWRIQKQQENAEEVARRGKTLHDRLRKFFGSIGEVGRALDRTVEKFNDSVRKMDNVLVPGRELGKLLGSTDDLQVVESIDTAIRPVSFDDPE